MVPVCPHSGDFGRVRRTAAWCPARRSLTRVILVGRFCSFSICEVVGITLATPLGAGHCFVDVCFIIDSPGSSLGFSRHGHQPFLRAGVEPVWGRAAVRPLCGFVFPAPLTTPSPCRQGGGRESMQLGWRRQPAFRVSCKAVRAWCALGRA